MASDDHRPSTRSSRRAHRLDVTVVDIHGHPIRMRRLACWLQRVAPPQAQGSVSIALLSDRSVRGLNRRYRQVDSATDVLSFPAFARVMVGRASARLAGAHPQEHSPPRRARRSNPACSSVSSVVESFLGDIAIARGVARRQARAARHSELTELRLLALHGLLHLLGYDHERDDGEMRRVERRLRRRGGLREGLIERQRHALPPWPERRGGGLWRGSPKRRTRGGDPRPGVFADTTIGQASASLAKAPEAQRRADRRRVTTR